MASKRGIALTLGRIGSLYNEPVTDVLIDIWHGALGQFEDDEIRDALNRHVADPEAGRFFPKPADVVRNLAGTWGERSLMAWTTFERALMRHGPYVPLVFEDERIHAVVRDMGGMSRFVESTDRDWPFIAKEFQTRYAGYRRPPEVEVVPLLGAGNGFQGTQEPLRIGGEQKRLESSKPRLELVTDE